MRAKRIKYMVREGDCALDGEHSTEYIDVVLKSCTPEIYTILLTILPPIILIKIFLKDKIPELK